MTDRITVMQRNVVVDNKTIGLNEDGEIALISNFDYYLNDNVLFFKIKSEVAFSQGPLDEFVKIPETEFEVLDFSPVNKMLRVSWDMRRFDGPPGRVKVYVNDIPVSNVIIASSSYGYHYEDIEVKNGDRIALYSIRYTSNQGVRINNWGVRGVFIPTLKFE